VLVILDASKGTLQVDENKRVIEGPASDGTIRGSGADGGST
jgi:hypothetical protein